MLYTDVATVAAVALLGTDPVVALLDAGSAVIDSAVPLADSEAVVLVVVDSAGELFAVVDDTAAVLFAAVVDIAAVQFVVVVDTAAVMFAVDTVAAVRIEIVEDTGYRTPFLLAEVRD